MIATNLFWYNIRMRLIEWLSKPEDIYMIGYEWTRKLGKL